MKGTIGLVFGMLIALLTIGILIAFGYQQLNNMIKTQQMVEIERTVNNLDDVVNTVYNFGGESSKNFKLTFPSSVTYVCFMPYYRGETPLWKQTRIRSDLSLVLEEFGGMSGIEKNQFSDLLMKMRIDDSPSGKVDEGQTLLIFYEDKGPEWRYIKHLEPTKKDNDIICVTGQSEVWLKRYFDDDGAWVDVEEI